LYRATPATAERIIEAPRKKVIGHETALPHYFCNSRRKLSRKKLCSLPRSNNPGANLVFDSSQIPGHIKDLTIVNTQTLAANPNFGKALVGAWFELMADLGSDSEAGQKARAFLGAASGTDQAGYEAQLAGMRMFWQASDAVSFISSDEAIEAMDSVRQFSFEKGLLGDGAPSPDFVGISFPDGKTLGDTANIRLRFDPSYMQMVADDAL
jgi:NitT/TauT family transport system substrate-binding protein